MNGTKEAIGEAERRMRAAEQAAASARSEYQAAVQADRAAEATSAWELGKHKARQRLVDLGVLAEDGTPTDPTMRAQGA